MVYIANPGPVRDDFYQGLEPFCLPKFHTLKQLTIKLNHKINKISKYYFLLTIEISSLLLTECAKRLCTSPQDKKTKQNSSLHSLSNVKKNQQILIQMCNIILI